MIVTIIIFAYKYGILGKIGGLQPAVEDWTLCEASRILHLKQDYSNWKNKKIMYKLLHSMLAPEKPGHAPFEGMVKVLKVLLENYSPKPSEIVIMFQVLQSE